MQPSRSSSNASRRGNVTALPKGVLQDVLGCLTYNDVVRLMLASRLLRDLARKCVERYGTTAKNACVYLEDNAIGVRMQNEANEWRYIYRVVVCVRAASYSSCEAPLCSSVHLAEAACKVRNLIGFSRLQEVQIWVGWNDVLMSGIATHLPALKSPTTARLGARPSGRRPEAAELRHFLEFFERVCYLYLLRFEEPFDWTILRAPLAQKLKMLHISGLDGELDSEDALRYCVQPCSDEPSSRKRIDFIGMPVATNFLKKLYQAVESAEHKIIVVFEDTRVITVDDLSYKKKLRTRTESGRETALASRRTSAVFYRATSANDRRRYVITNQPPASDNK